MALLSLTSTALLLSGLITTTHAAPAPAELTTVTLLRSNPESTAIPAAVTRLTVLGVNDAGGTTYVEELVYTNMVSWTRDFSFVGSDSDPNWIATTTQVGEPYETTITETFVQDATRVSGSYLFTDPVIPTRVVNIEHYCDFNADGDEAVCGADILLVSPAATEESVFREDWTDPAGPWATIEVGEGGSVRVLNEDRSAGVSNIAVGLVMMTTTVLFVTLAM